MSKFGKAEGYEEMNDKSNQGDKDQEHGEPTRIWGANGPKEVQIDSSSKNVGPSSDSGIMQTLFGGMNIN